MSDSPATIYDPAVNRILDALKLQGRRITKLVIKLESAHPLVQVEITEEITAKDLDGITGIITNYELTRK